MASPPLAEVEQLEAWLGFSVSDSASDLLRAEAVISAASALVRGAAGQTWLNDTGDLEGVPEVAGIVVIQAAARVYRNPTGITQETTGPFSRSFGSAAAHGLYLTDTEREMVAGPSSGLSSVRVEAPALAAGRPRTSYGWWCTDDDE